MNVAPRSSSRLARVGAAELAGAGRVEIEPAELAGEVHRGLAARLARDLHRVHGVAGDHDGDVGRRRVRHRRRRIPRHTRERVTGHEAVDPVVVAARLAKASIASTVGTNGAGAAWRPSSSQSTATSTAPSPTPAALLGNLDPEPALLGHRGPQRGVVRSVGARVGAHPAG